MNLGTTEVKAVKTFTPQIINTPTQRSQSISEDEYFSDYASDASSTKNPHDRLQYETPPSRISTPTVQNPVMDSEMTLPARPAPARQSPTRRSVGAPMRDIQREYEDRLMNMSPPTPGVDDTPYLRFALDQLTRDEELLGHGRHGSITSTDYPVERIVPDDGLGYYKRPVPTAQPPRKPSQRQSGAGTFEKHEVKDEILLPVAAPRGTQWSNLQFVPIILRLPFLLLLIFACILMITGIVFSNVHASRSNGLYGYDGTGTARFFVFQFLPQLLGIFIILWLHVLQAAIYRVVPYFAMANEPPRDRVIQEYRIVPANFVLPDLSFFSSGDAGAGLVLFVFWLTNFTVPLLSCFYQTEYFINIGATKWRWTTTQGVGWILVVLYALLVLALIYCIFRFRRRKSALMWDPVSLADLIPLFQKSNVLTDFEQTEVSRSTRNAIPPKFLRLGYWTSSRGPEIFYTIGEEGAPYKRLSDPLPNLDEKRHHSKDSGHDRDNSFDVENARYSGGSAFTRNLHSPFTRHRHIPWFLRDSLVLLWAILAIILLLAFLIVSFVNHAVEKGFAPLLSAATNSLGFSPADFLYSFLPSLLGMWLFLLWQPIDTFFRSTQAFANLSNPAGATAERSLLLSYPAKWPVSCTIAALINRDFRIVFTSFIALLSATFPVLAGGVFTAQFFASRSNAILVTATMPAYYALCVFLAIYAFAFLGIFPTRKRRLPHSTDTIAGQLSFLYQSPLLSDPNFKSVNTKHDLNARLLTSLSGDAKGGPTYGFGIHIGRDGREHLGIDRLQRPNSGEMLITSGMPAGRMMSRRAARSKRLGASEARPMRERQSLGTRTLMNRFRR